MSRADLENARNDLSNASSGKVAHVQVYALRSIAASLLHIAETLDKEPESVALDEKAENDRIELVVRRLLDEVLAPVVGGKGRKS